MDKNVTFLQNILPRDCTFYILVSKETKQLEATKLYTKILKTRNVLLDEMVTSDPGPVHQPSAVDESCVV